MSRHAPQMYGYARVSTADQSLDVQRAALKAAGCAVVRAEKVSGTSRNGRSELATLLDFIRPGDTLVVTRIDRLARSMHDLQNIVHELREKGAYLKAIEQAGIDTSSPEGECFLNMLGTFAQFETAIRKERQMEGITRRKREGGYAGKAQKIGAAEVKRLLAEGKGATAVAKQLGIGRASVYRLVKA